MQVTPGSPRNVQGVGIGKERATAGSFESYKMTLEQRWKSWLFSFFSRSRAEEVKEDFFKTLKDRVISDATGARGGLQVLEAGEPKGKEALTRLAEILDNIMQIPESEMPKGKKMELFFEALGSSHVRKEIQEFAKKSDANEEVKKAASHLVQAQEYLKGEQAKVMPALKEMVETTYEGKVPDVVGNAYKVAFVSTDIKTMEDLKDFQESMARSIIQKMAEDCKGDKRKLAILERNVSVFLNSKAPIGMEEAKKEELIGIVKSVSGNFFEDTKKAIVKSRENFEGAKTDEGKVRYLKELGNLLDTVKNLSEDSLPKTKKRELFLEAVKSDIEFMDRMYHAASEQGIENLTESLTRFFNERYQEQTKAIDAMQTMCDQMYEEKRSELEEPRAKALEAIRAMKENSGSIITDERLRDFQEKGLSKLIDVMVKQCKGDLKKLDVVRQNLEKLLSKEPAITLGEDAKQVLLEKLEKAIESVRVEKILMDCNFEVNALRREIEAKVKEYNGNGARLKALEDDLNEFLTSDNARRFIKGTDADWLLDIVRIPGFDLDKARLESAIDAADRILLNGQVIGDATRAREILQNLFKDSVDTAEQYLGKIADVMLEECKADFNKFATLEGEFEQIIEQFDENTLSKDQKNNLMGRIQLVSAYERLKKLIEEPIRIEAEGTSEEIEQMQNEAFEDRVAAERIAAEQLGLAFQKISDKRTLGDTLAGIVYDAQVKEQVEFFARRANAGIIFAASFMEQVAAIAGISETVIAVIGDTNRAKQIIKDLRDNFSRSVDDYRNMANKLIEECAADYDKLGVLEQKFTALLEQISERILTSDQKLELLAGIQIEKEGAEIIPKGRDSCKEIERLVESKDPGKVTKIVEEVKKLGIILNDIMERPDLEEARKMELILQIVQDKNVRIQIEAVAFANAEEEEAQKAARYLKAALEYSAV